MGSGVCYRAGWRMSYDPEARRDTPLALRLKERIRREGPISAAEFMNICLRDQDHGYYVTKDAIGAGADFITAPEISQVFGELIGLWCAVVWQQMGSPSKVNLVEWGPGRGTMMRDALRALKIMPEMLEAVEVRLLEQSATLTAVQKATLAGAPATVTWWKLPWDIPKAPTILVANELLDTFSCKQLVKTEHGWRNRGVGIGGAEQLVFVEMDEKPEAPIPHNLNSAPTGSIFEYATCGAVADELPYFAGQVLAALFLDYGHMEPGIGETLQALRRHQPEHPLCSPGEADLTVHVNFSEFAKQARGEDFAIDGPVTQAEFLGRLGIIERASKLMTANPEKAAEIEAGVARLIAPNGMGTRFKAIGIRSAGLPPLPGFA